MEIRKFAQRKITGRRDFELTEDGIFVKESEFGNKRKYLVPYESLGTEKIEITTFSKRLAWAAFITTCIFVLFFAGWMTTHKDLGIMLFWGSTALMCGTYLFISWQKYIVYAGENATLIFYADIPSKEQLEAFIADVDEARKNYLLSKYAYSQSQTAPDQIMKLTWLRNNGALSEDEFERMKQRIVTNFEIDGNLPL
jgi:hypothetical protein